MNMKSITFVFRSLVYGVLLLAFASPALAQQGWVPSRIGPAKKDLNTVYFLDNKRGWVAGDEGFLSRTDDGGRTWIQQAVGITDAINDIYFRTKEDGFLLAGNAIFISRVAWASVVMSRCAMGAIKRGKYSSASPSE